MTSKAESDLHRHSPDNTLDTSHRVAVFGVVLALSGVRCDRGMLPQPATRVELRYELSGTALQGGFGTAVCEIGQVDGDPIGDFAVSAPGSGSRDRPGAVFVISGTDGETIATLSPIGPFTAYGRSMVSLGDLDGDGSADIAIGAPGPDIDAQGTGRQTGVEVRSSRNGAHLWTFHSPTESRRCGVSVAVLRDVDADSVADIAIGAPAVGNSSAGGGVYIVSTGKKQILHALDRAQDRVFGAQVVCCGDVDGDSAEDIAVLANRHEVVVVSGQTGKTIRVISGEGGYPRLIGGHIDVDRDGHAELLVAYEHLGFSPGSTGKSVVYSGASGLPITTLPGAAFQGCLIQDSSPRVCAITADGHSFRIQDLEGGASMYEWDDGCAGTAVVSRVGDIDGDLKDDCVVACPAADVRTDGRSLKMAGIIRAYRVIVE